MFEKYTDAQTFARIREYDSVTAMWQDKVAEFGGVVAIEDAGERYTYARIDEEVVSLRGVLLAKGIKKGDCVGVFAPNSFAFVRAYLAVVTAGAVAVLLPPHLDETTVFGCSLKFSLKALVVADELRAKTAFAAEKNPRLTLIGCGEAGDPAPAVPAAGEDGCAVLFTGGTTGKSKGALLSHRAVMAGTRNGCYGIRKVFGLRYLLVLPLTHVFGLIRNLMTSLYTGSTLFICRNNKDMFKDIAVFRPDILVLVPALAEMALGLSKQFGRNMLGDSLKTIICGAAFVPPYLIAEYKKLGVSLFPGYGLTESANLVSGNAETETKPDSVGYPYPGQELKIVDGELWLKGTNMMSGYVGDEEENRAAYSDGWFRTGDLVRMDEDGFLYIVGRIKEVIVLSTGENISPAEIENKFDSHPAVQDCLVYAKTENGKELLVLEVLPRRSELAKADAADKEAYLKEELNKINQTLPSFARVSRIIIRETDFKRSPSMKILRNGQ